MNAKDIVILVCEKKSPAPYWTHAHGIYADLSNWPKNIEYYVKCPECGNVHGMYPSMADARVNRLCPSCEYDKVEKSKKELAKISEAEIPIPPEQPSEPNPDQPFDPDTPYDAKAELGRYMHGDWVTVAKWQLEKETGDILVFDDEDYRNREIDYEDPDSFTQVKFKIEGSDEGYIVWKDESDAIVAAEEDCKNSFESEPSIYMSWLRQYIDMNKVSEALQGDEENMTRERFDEEYSDYESQVKEMVDKGKLHEETFYKLNGELRKETPVRQQLLAQAIDEWVTETAREMVSDPEEYLKDMGYDDTGGKNPYTGEKIETLGDMLERLGGIDYEKAAKEAVSADGWAHTLARQDGKGIYLTGGAVAVRD